MGDCVGSEGNSIISDNMKIADFLEEYSQHHLSVLLLDKSAKLFIRKNIGGVGFVKSGKSVLSIGGVMAKAGQEHEVLSSFLEWVKEDCSSVVFVHFPIGDFKFMAPHGFRVNQVGASYSKSFDDCQTKGKSYQQVRRKLNKAIRSEVVVEEIIVESEFLKLKSDLIEINSRWQKNKRAKPLRHLVFDFNTLTFPDENNRLFVAHHQNQVIAYAIFSRTYGRQSGWFCNLSRYRKEGVDGAAHLIMSKMLASMEAGIMHFGFTPLVEMGQDVEKSSGVFSKIANKLSEYGGIVYPSASQRQYKMSWNPTQVEAEYFAYQKGVLPDVFRLLRMTNSI